jgi:hypothetical protein
MGRTRILRDPPLPGPAHHHSATSRFLPLTPRPAPPPRRARPATPASCRRHSAAPSRRRPRPRARPAPRPRPESASPPWCAPAPPRHQVEPVPARGLVGSFRRRREGVDPGRPERRGTVRRLPYPGRPRPRGPQRAGLQRRGVKVGTTPPRSHAAARTRGRERETGWTATVPRPPTPPAPARTPRLRSPRDDRRRPNRGCHRA